MGKSSGVTVVFEFTPDNHRRIEELIKKSGVSDFKQLCKVAFDFFEKTVDGASRGYHIGSVPESAEAGKDGIVEVLMSQEILAHESVKSR